MKNYFTNVETSCRCGCGENNLCSKSLKKMNEARKIADIPFVPSSVCRCKKHNRKERSRPTSSHISDTKNNIKCTAWDIKVSNSNQRFVILEALILAGFTRIGVAKTFIHADTDSSKSPEVVWLY